MKVYVEMDQGFVWWLVKEADLDLTDRPYKTERLNERAVAIEVEEKTFEEYAAIAAKYYEMQREVENLYRKQEGLDPWPDTVPDNSI